MRYVKLSISLHSLQYFRFVLKVSIHIDPFINNYNNKRIKIPFIYGVKSIIYLVFETCARSRSHNNNELHKWD